MTGPTRHSRPLADQGRDPIVYALSRLSRAGRFSLAPGGERSARFSEGLSAVGEEGDEGENTFGPPSGLSEMYDEDDEDDREYLW